jgi:hypothetical protein
LAVHNIRQTKMDQGILAEMLSKNVMKSYFGDQKLQAQNLIKKFDNKLEKKEREVHELEMSKKKPSVF